MFTSDIVKNAFLGIFDGVAARKPINWRTFGFPINSKFSKIICKNQSQGKL